MTNNLDELRKTAENATPGPWDLYSSQDYEVFCAANFTDYDYDPPAVTYGSDRSEDAEFIATFDPPTVLELLARLEQAEQQVARVREVHKPTSDPFGTSCAVCIGDSRRNPYPCETIRALDGDGRG